MKGLASTRELDYQWAGITALSGNAAILSYVAVLAASHATTYAVVLAFAFAFGITVSSIGLYHILGGASGPRMALIAAVSNGLAASQLLAMLMVQMAVYALVPQPETALKAVWMGLDVAWDLYLCVGTILFAICMFGRSGLGAWLGVSGLLVSTLLLILNLATFPIPPENAGLVDFGPLVGMWYLVVYMRLGVAAFRRGMQPRRSAAGLAG